MQNCRNRGKFRNLKASHFKIAKSSTSTKWQKPVSWGLSRGLTIILIPVKIIFWRFFRLPGDAKFTCAIFISCNWNFMILCIKSHKWWKFLKWWSLLWIFQVSDNSKYYFIIIITSFFRFYRFYFSHLEKSKTSKQYVKNSFMWNYMATKFSW